MASLRRITYARHEFHGEPEVCEGTVLTFLYDVPYFPACGVFPSLHILNQVLAQGGGQGGMSPGATWEPFTLSTEESAALVEALRTTPLSEIQPHARYAGLPMTFDPAFDHITDWSQWRRAVCEKLRDHWLAELKDAEGAP